MYIIVIVNHIVLYLWQTNFGSAIKQESEEIFSSEKLIDNQKAESCSGLYQIWHCNSTGGLSYRCSEVS